MTSPQLYSALHTDDIRVAVMHISKLYPRAPLIGVGFSLGANVLTRYVAQEGENCRLAAGCALGSVSVLVLTTFLTVRHSNLVSPPHDAYPLSRGISLYPVTGTCLVSVRWGPIPSARPHKLIRFAV